MDDDVLKFKWIKRSKDEEIDKSIFSTDYIQQTPQSDPEYYDKDLVDGIQSIKVNVLKRDVIIYIVM